MNLRFKIFFLLFLVKLSAFSQNAELDSLLAKSERLVQSKMDSSLRLAFMAAELSQQKKDQVYITRSYIAIGNTYDNMDDADNAITYYKKSIEASKNVTDESLKMTATLSLAQAYFDKGNYDEALMWFRKAK